MRSSRLWLLITALVVLILVAPIITYVVGATSGNYLLTIRVKRTTFILFINNTFKGIFYDTVSLILRRGTYGVSVIGFNTGWVNRTVVLDRSKVINIKLIKKELVSVKAVVKGNDKYVIPQAAILINGRLRYVGELSNHTYIGRVYDTEAQEVSLCTYGSELINLTIPSGKSKYLIINPSILRKLGLGVLKVRVSFVNEEPPKVGKIVLLINDTYLTYITRNSINSVLLHSGTYKVKALIPVSCSLTTYWVCMGASYVSNDTYVKITPGRVTEVVMNLSLKYLYKAKVAINIKYLGSKYVNYYQLVGMPIWVKGFEQLVSSKLVMLSNLRTFYVLPLGRDYLYTTLSKVNVGKLGIKVESPVYIVKSVSTKTRVGWRDRYVNYEVRLSSGLGRVVFKGLSKYVKSPTVYLLISDELLNTYSVSTLERSGLYLPPGNWCLKLAWWGRYLMRSYVINTCFSIRAGDYLELSDEDYEYRNYTLVSSTSVTYVRGTTISLRGIDRSEYPYLKVIIIKDGVPIPYRSLIYLSNLLKLSNVMLSNKSLKGEFKVIARNVRSGALYVGTFQSSSLVPLVSMERVNSDLRIKFVSNESLRVVALGIWIDGKLVGATSNYYSRKGINELLLKGLSSGDHVIKLLMRVCKTNVGCTTSSVIKSINLRPGSNSLSINTESSLGNEGTTKLIIKDLIKGISGDVLVITSLCDVRTYPKVYLRSGSKYLVINDLVRGDYVKVVTTSDTYVVRKFRLGNLTIKVALGPSNYYTPWIKLVSSTNEVRLRSDYTYLIIYNIRSYSIGALVLDSLGRVCGLGSISHNIKYVTSDTDYVLPIKLRRDCIGKLKIYLRVIKPSLTKPEIKYVYYVLPNSLVRGDGVKFINLDVFKSMDGYLRLEPISSLSNKPPYLEPLVLFINGYPRMTYLLVPPNKYFKVLLPLSKLINLTLYSVRHEPLNAKVKLNRSNELLKLKLRFNGGRAVKYVKIHEVLIDGVKYLKVSLSINEVSQHEELIPPTMDLIINGSTYTLVKDAVTNEWVALIPTKVLGSGVKELIIKVGNAVLYKGFIKLGSGPKVVTELSRYLVRVGDGVKVRIKLLNTNLRSHYVLRVTLRKLGSSGVINEDVKEFKDVSSGELVINFAPKEAGIYVVITELLLGNGLISKSVSKELVVLPKDEVTILTYVPEVRGNELVINGLAYVPWGNEVKVRIYLNDELVHEEVVTNYFFKYSWRVSEGKEYLVAIKYLVDGEEVASDEAVIKVK